MAVAGIAWGFYSLVGRSAGDPTEATAWNFVFSVPLVVVTSLVFLGEFQVSPAGAAYAVASGAIASGIGYVIWYAALRGLTATSAATVQLSVPVIAAIGGVILMSEDVTLRLIVASAATLGGVALVKRRLEAQLQQEVVIDEQRREQYCEIGNREFEGAHRQRGVLLVDLHADREIEEHPA